MGLTLIPYIHVCELTKGLWCMVLHGISWDLELRQMILQVPRSVTKNVCVFVGRGEKHTGQQLTSRWKMTTDYLAICSGPDTPDSGTHRVYMDVFTVSANRSRTRGHRDRPILLGHFMTFDGTVSVFSPCRRHGLWQAANAEWKVWRIKTTLTYTISLIGCFTL